MMKMYTKVISIMCEHREKRLSTARKKALTTCSAGWHTDSLPTVRK